jgi:hypothetical protein
MNRQFLIYDSTPYSQLQTYFNIRNYNILRHLTAYDKRVSDNDANVFHMLVSKTKHLGYFPY